MGGRGDGGRAGRAAVAPAGRLRRRLELLADVGQALTVPLDLEQLFRVLYRETARVLDASIFILGLYDEPSQTVRVVKQVYGGVERAGGSFPLGAGISSEAIRTRQPSLIRHWAREGPPANLRYASDGGALPESALTVPLLRGERVVGVLLLQSYQPEAYDQDDLATLRAIAGQAATAIENLRRSERLDAELERRVSELEAILASMADALVIVDADGAIVGLNPAARALLCAEGDSIVLGRPLDEQGWERWPPGVRAVVDLLAPLVEAVRRGEARRDVEAELRAGGLRVLSFSSAPLLDADRRPTGGIIVIRDVTGRREVERLKDEVLSIASHDLRQPAAVLLGRAQLLQRRIARGALDPDDLASGLGTIVGQAGRLIEMLNLLLDFSRAEAGRFEIAPESTDLVGLARRVVEAAEATTDRHRLLLRAPPRADGLWDERRLEQLLQNLVGNAIKYSPEGGEVEVVIEAGDEHALVTVRDEGLGLAPDELERVFERFYRAGSTGRLEGSGLGLHICQTIAAAHGGRLWVESAGVGQGSAFVLRLPWRAPISQPA
jgi:PAS domain S-box-containing protein